MDRIICITLEAFRDILARRIHELLLCPECHESIFTNLQQKNITILTDRRMINSVCLECPTTKAKERNDVSQIKASQNTKPLNHNSDMIEAPIIKEQEVLEPISYPENSTLYNNSQNDPGSCSRRNHPPL
ncbi:10249_t:CDS:1 [Funneliformis geosporum]|uniref:10249_t:CDS:1 n=1 Tax=Funneliformis geosporum TaxID=1117311 RepID=A0A9W4T2D5_9GLOM|nr:10249_t:CDS:1 [Funneliformis geosporum]